jgi:hypothetical protein
VSIERSPCKIGTVYPQPSPPKNGACAGRVIPLPVMRPVPRYYPRPRRWAEVYVREHSTS